MSGGPRPPVPGLIPLAALSRRPGRPRRRPESIDAGAGSRCLETRAAAPGRRRHHRRRASAAAAVSKQSRSSSPALERPPRVNPIFVWVRQEDTRIVDVKCEDYDKRNRILLTKTAHGWRAIPRTEMLGVPRVSAEETLTSQASHSHHHRHHHKRRSRKSKNQQSTSSQFPEPIEPSWVTTENVNIESLLPSHTIQIKRIPSSEDLSKSVNSASEQTFARTIPECNPPDKVCDVSPLENLLAVAELELKQQMQSGNWSSDIEEHPKEVSEPLDRNISEIDEILKTKSQDIETDLLNNEQKSQECSYNDDDEMSMNDILSRLEQSLQSPHGFGSENAFDDEIIDENCKFDKGCSLSDETSKNLACDLIPERPGSYDVEVKEEYTENNLVDYTDLYNSENKMCELIEAEKCLELSENTEDSTKTDKECSEIELHTEYQTECPENESDDLKDKFSNSNDRGDDIGDQNSDDHGNEENNILNDSENKTTHLGNITDDFPCEGKMMEPDTLEDPPEEQNCQEEDELVKENKESENNVAEAEPSTNHDERSSSPKEESTEMETEMDTSICLDLSIKSKPNLISETLEQSLIEENEDGPTDLCMRKHESPLILQPPRPPSQNSEAIQSPQPSGIPAVPASPDIVSTSTSISKPRSVFLESLLANSINKIASSTTDVILSKSKEPLDLGQCRKSASPTVTCSEEAVTPSSDSEPPLKKLKPDDITLKNLLDKDIDMLEQISVKTTPKETTILPDTPRLLSLLKASSDTQDPVAEYKQLLLEIDIPNPLMVPKDVFPDLLKHPRREVLKILSGHSSKNVALDDILVVYKDKLLAAIESSQNKATLGNIVKQSEIEKSASKQSTNKSVEQNNNASEKINHAHITNKRKNIDNSNKNSGMSSDNKNSLASDIDAANEAALNPLFWAGCPNPFEAMNSYSNHNEFIQALYAASSLPYLPGQLGELHPGIQMMLGNKISAPLGFPPLPHINFNSPFELSMWQEAMMQASILKNKNPYENPLTNQQNNRSNMHKKTHQQNHINKHGPRMTNGHTKNDRSQAQHIQQQSMVHPAFTQAALNNPSNWQNPYLGFGNFPQGINNLSLDTTQFNPFSHKNSLSPTNKPSQQLSPPMVQKKSKESNAFSQFNEEKRLHHQMMQEHQKMQHIQHQKLVRHHQHQQLLQQQQQQQQQMLRQSNNAKQPLNKRTNFPNEHLQDKFVFEMQKQSGLPAPIDLSGAQNIHSKTKSSITGNGKSNGMVTSSRSLAEDIPEVGSTTGSVEDMQDSHAQLWHPLFGSQNKGYHPWNIPSLATMGE